MVLDEFTERRMKKRGIEIANKAMDIVINKDEDAFNEYMNTLTIEEIKSYENVMDEYKRQSDSKK